MAVGESEHTLAQHSRNRLSSRLHFVLVAIWEMAAAGDSASRSCGERSVKTAVLQQPLQLFTIICGGLTTCAEGPL